MRIRITTPDPVMRNLILALSPRTRVLGTLAGHFFMLIGPAFQAGSLPHTEFLRSQKSLSALECTTGQSIAPRWVLSEQSVVVGRECRAEVEEFEDEGNLRYRLLVKDGMQMLTFGKTKSDRTEAVELGASYQWHEEIW